MVFMFRCWMNKQGNFQENKECIDCLTLFRWTRSGKYHIQHILQNISYAGSWPADCF